MKRAAALFTAVILALGVLALPVATQAQQGLPPHFVYATQYNAWGFNSVSASTYTFPGSNCWVSPLTDGVTASFFAFGNSNTSVYFPVFIQDANPANSEIVTPTSISTTPSSCGFSASTTYTHTSFSVKSGTAGLQEAVYTNSQPSTTSSTATDVLIDRTYYGLVAGLPQSQTVAGIIAALKGGSNVQIVDITTGPWTVYNWNGTSYVATSAPAQFPNLKVSSYTAIAAPTALSTSASTSGLITTATTGGSIPASSTYRLAATYVDASGGETLISTDSASTATIQTGATATNTISVTSPATATGAVGWRLYMTAASGASGSEILYTPTCSTTSAQPLQTVLVNATVCPIGATATITAIITGTADVPLVANAFPRSGGTSSSFPPYAALGTVAAAATGDLGIINFPAGYWNSLGKTATFCGNGYATTNSTAGTLTLKAVFDSVGGGVTGITPWSVVSGSTAASAQADPFNFCMTITTAATGSSGTLEVHGCVNYSLSGTAPVTGACDIVTAVSSTVDLTKQDQLIYTITPTTTALTAAQLRQLTLVATN